MRTRDESTRPRGAWISSMVLRRQATGLHEGTHRQGLLPTTGSAASEVVLAGNKGKCSLVSTPRHKAPFTSQRRMLDEVTKFLLVLKSRHLIFTGMSAKTKKFAFLLGVF